jgi:phosphoglycolate phosphatase-like HAD superfamily hydrolase
MLRPAYTIDLAGTLIHMPSAEPSHTPHILVLWDVDHTLIETRGVGFAIYKRAFPTATGRPLNTLAQVSGRTELDIMRETLRVNGIEPTDKSIAKLATALINGYENARDELATTGRALPGAAETLDRLAAEPGVHQGVLTGNLRDVARIKLEVFGLDTRLDLEASAYGDDHSERPKLVAIAQARASNRTRTTFDNQHTILIGDTPKDIEAGLTAGIRTIAVASGKSTAKELRTAGATIIIDDLTDPEHITQLLITQASAG